MSRRLAFPWRDYYLTYWFPKAQRARATAVFMTAIAVSGVLVGPISGWILQAMDGFEGLSGWQWLFVLEGLPAVLLGIACLFYLPASPATPRWLSQTEKDLLARTLAADVGDSARAPLREALKSSRSWLLSAIYGCYGVSFFGFVSWLPTIVKSAGVQSPLHIGLLTAIPWTVAVIAMFFVAAQVDRRQNTLPVLMALSILAAAGWVVSPAVSHSVGLSLAALSLAMFGLMASLPVFWNLPTSAYQGGTASIAIAIVTSLGNGPGFFSPYIVGWLKEVTRSMDAAMYLFATVTLLATALLAIYRKSYGRNGNG